MIPRGGPPGPRHRTSALLLLAVGVRLYGALLALYPEAFRRRYEAEMRRDFRELLREELEEEGATGLVRVLTQAVWDLVLTALKERGIMPARLAYYLSVYPRKAASAMVGAVVIVAVAVTLASLTRTPTYEASAQVWVDQKQGDQQTNLAETVEGLQTIMLAMIHAIDSRPAAEEAIQRLGLEMTPAELLDNLSIEQVESTSFIVLTYEDTNPVEAARIVNTVGEVSSELISERSAAGSQLTANVYEEAMVPESPVSPDPLRNGLLTLVIGLMLCAGPVVALPGVGASLAGTLSEWSVRTIGEAGAPAVPPVDPSEAERIKEKELLEALVRCGKLTAVEAALETSLSVEEADRMLSELAVKGHLEVTVEHGRLHYALWEPDAPS
jgi:capsular polysaccharide biosynthesis protein